jgi:integrase
MKSEGEMAKVVRRKRSRQRGSGSIQWRDGRCYVRVGHTDPITGKRSEVIKRARDEEHAQELLTRLLYERQETGGNSVEHANKTFADLAARFERLHMVEAQYSEKRGGRIEKVDGLRAATLRNMKSLLSILRRELGTTELRKMNANFLVDFRRRRINAPVSCRRCMAKPEHASQHKADEQPGKRTMTTVHRELMLLNQMLNVAVREDWIRKNPFGGFPRGKSLIQVKRFEPPRERVMTPDEEQRILAAFGTSREHRRCRLIVIALADTGMRKGELFGLQWSDVDLASDRIHVPAIINKTLKSRTVAISARLHDELLAWRAIYDAGNDKPLIGSTGNVNEYWAKAKTRAEVSDLRFHDLRHTAATRLEGAGMKESAVAKVLGHSRIQQTRTYINPDQELILSTAASLIDAVNEANAKTAAANGAASDGIN